jgi:hypothetical protein
VCRVLGILVAVAAAWAGCATTNADEHDAAEPSMDAGRDSAAEHDTGLTPVDARDDSRTGGDARTEPVACEPAACDAADGGADGFQPPWGCPEVCDDACTGDTVCCESGQCQDRRLHDCTDGCDLELTVRGPALQCPFQAPLTAEVCNRGTTTDAEPGQVVRFEGSESIVCEAVTTTSIPPCSCVEVSCQGAHGGNVHVRPILNPDDPLPDCGNPLGHIGREAFSGACE